MNLVKRLNSIESNISEIKSLLQSQSLKEPRKEILTAQETIDLLKITRSTFDKWRSYSFLKVYTINRRLYCKYSEIMEALENGIIEQKSQ